MQTTGFLPLELSNMGKRLQIVQQRVDELELQWLVWSEELEKSR